MKKNVLPIYIVLILIAQGIYIIKQSYGLGFSVTPSLPYSIFFINKKDKDFSKDDLIVFQYPGDNIYSYKKDEQFVKIVSCLPGEILKVNEQFEYFCNEKRIGKANLKDSQNNTLNHFIFNGPIPKDNYFVIGTHAKSWDSKYWGFVSKERIIATAKGLL